MNAGADSVLWNSYKTVIDSDRRTTKRTNRVPDTVGDTTLDWCLGGLCELFILVLHDRLQSAGGPLPPPTAIRSLSSSDHINFVYFIYLRLGDVFRYKNDPSKALMCYETALAMNASDGRAWNQVIALVERVEHRLPDRRSALLSSSPRRRSLLLRSRVVAHDRLPSGVGEYGAVVREGRSSWSAIASVVMSKCLQTSKVR